MGGDLVQDVHKEHRPRKAGAKVFLVPEWMDGCWMPSTTWCLLEPSAFAALTPTPLHSSQPQAKKKEAHQKKKKGLSTDRHNPRAFSVANIRRTQKNVQRNLDRAQRCVTWA